MCLIAFAWKAHPDCTLLLAANRDEWRDRPSAPATWWPEAPGILAGRDLRAGGTWLGITRKGRFAALTNVRDPSDRKAQAPSRGQLVRDFLLGVLDPEAYLSGLLPHLGSYQGFNLLAGDRNRLLCLSTLQGGIAPVAPGVHALSNHSLDEPWPKVTRAKAGLLELQAETGQDSALMRDQLLRLLSDPSPAPDATLPDTGVGLEWERRLSPALIVGEDYGTRCSTVLRLEPSGRARFDEYTRKADGRIVDHAGFEFVTG